MKLISTKYVLNIFRAQLLWSPCLIFCSILSITETFLTVKLTDTRSLMWNGLKPILIYKITSSWNNLVNHHRGIYFIWFANFKFCKYLLALFMSEAWPPACPWLLSLLLPFLHPHSLFNYRSLWLVSFAYDFSWVRISPTFFSFQWGSTKQPETGLSNRPCGEGVRVGICVSYRSQHVCYVESFDPAYASMQDQLHPWRPVSHSHAVKHPLE